ncbi:hypothetical protein Acr_02g0001480 [Actinidia rufa]|uniref:Uncharacterized protein n=1 Tax=Actinidia rufa TaxID=165716 RepID=A0A7J0E650_9ERIC|nr:hypothetical protein Acr_02g0001480 [Actinidia rufa]
MKSYTNIVVESKLLWLITAKSKITIVESTIDTTSFLLQPTIIPSSILNQRTLAAIFPSPSNQSLFVRNLLLTRDFGWRRLPVMEMVFMSHPHKGTVASIVNVLGKYVGVKNVQQEKDELDVTSGIKAKLSLSFNLPSVQPPSPSSDKNKAANTCYVALHPQVKGMSRKYFPGSNIAEASSQADDTELVKKLGFQLEIG